MSFLATLISAVLTFAGAGTGPTALTPSSTVGQPALPGTPQATRLVDSADGLVIELTDGHAVIDGPGLVQVSRGRRPLEMDCRFKTPAAKLQRVMSRHPIGAIVRFYPPGFDVPITLAHNHGTAKLPGGALDGRYSHQPIAECTILTGYGQSGPYSYYQADNPAAAEQSGGSVPPGAY
jgi:hypothetical protein